MINRWLLALSLVSCVLFEARAERSVDAEQIATRDVIFFHRSYPVIFRLHLQLGEVSFDHPWRRQVATLFAQIDADRDRYLTPAETDRAATRAGTHQLASILRRADLWSADVDPFDHKITLVELYPYLIQRMQGPFQPPINQPPPPRGDNLGDVLFDLLDRDNSRQLSEDELLGAAGTIRRHDFDDDGTLSAGELLAGSRTPSRRPVGSSADAAAARFLAVVPGTSAGPVLQQLHKRYGSRSSGGALAADLRAGQLGLPDQAFAKYDADSSGGLDDDELRQFVRTWPPTLELRIRLGDAGQHTRRAELIDAATDAVSVRTAGQLVSIVLGDVQIEIQHEPVGPEYVRDYVAEQFSRADRDGNEYLDEQEIAQTEFFQDALPQLDTNGDGKLFADEWAAAFQMSAMAAATRARMSIRDRGRDLFQLLDGDRNGRLSSRELAAAIARLPLWDGNGDGQLGLNEVPQVFQMSCGPGLPAIGSLEFFELATSAGTAARGRLRGPRWFQQMDRNADGELARREFPGTRGEFRRLDADGSGIVDAGEATQAGKQ